MSDSKSKRMRGRIATAVDTCRQTRDTYPFKGVIWNYWQGMIDGLHMARDFVDASEPIEFELKQEQ
jgi:hypothetical protein